MKPWIKEKFGRLYFWFLNTFFQRKEGQTPKRRPGRSQPIVIKVVNTAGHSVSGIQLFGSTKNNKENNFGNPSSIELYNSLANVYYQELLNGLLSEDLIIGIIYGRTDDEKNIGEDNFETELRSPLFGNFSVQKVKVNSVKALREKNRALMEGKDEGGHKEETFGSPFRLCKETTFHIKHMEANSELTLFFYPSNLEIQKGNDP